MKLAHLGLALTLTATAFAQTTFSDPANLRGERVKPRDGRELPVDTGALGLQQMLRRLNTRASIMNIVAHPDDEDGGMLTFYSRGVGARVADLSLTRGEGGQNAMTGDFEDALGLLRTQELLACDRYSGIDQFFGTEVDFGFSKTKEEAFGKWTHQRVLYDVVRAIRLYRPLVLTATFIGGVTDGHGQHQVSGEIAQEAFKAAGDPKIFPDLTAEGILPWQPLKVYARVPMHAITDKGLFDYATNQYTPTRFKNYVTGEVTTTQPSVDVVVHEGQPDSLLKDAEGNALSYVQYARTGLAQQKSQIGPGMRTPGPGKADVSYHLYGSRVRAENKPAQEASFFDGIDTSIEGIAQLAPDAFRPGQLAKIASDIRSAATQLNFNDPTAVAPILASALKGTKDLIAQVRDWKGDAVQKADALHELHVKRVQLEESLALSLGVSMDAVASSPDFLQNSEATVQVTRQKLPDEADSFPVFIKDSGSSIIATASNSSDFISLKLPAHSLSTVTEPYFYRDNIEQPVYKLRDAVLRNAASPPPTFTAWSRYSYRGVTFQVGRVVHSGTQAIHIVPPGSLSLSSHAQVLPESATSLVVKVSLFPVEHPPVTPALSLPSGWSSHATNSEMNSGTMSFTLDAPEVHHEVVIVKASAKIVGHETISRGYRAIGYEDLPRTNYFTEAEDRVVPVDLKLPKGRRIGYLPGTGDAVPEALDSIGLKPETLTLADINAESLKRFDTIILGVRTYAAHHDLHGAPTKALLDYARGGGNVVVQYQTAEFTGDDAPYPLTLGSDAEKVVDETDYVQLLAPNSPLLSTPNRITPADFDHWIEERGHGFLRTWDEKYTALTETHDPGEDPQKGGLITTQLGAGRWTYCAFAIYRQLPEAVPGAYRVFVNLLVK